MSVDTDNRLLLHADICYMVFKDFDTVGLANVRSICKRWKTAVDCISFALLYSLGIRVRQKEETTILVLQITKIYHDIVSKRSPIFHAEEMRAYLPRLERITDIKRTVCKLFENNIKLIPFLKSLDAHLPNTSSLLIFKTIFIIYIKDLKLATQHNSIKAFKYILKREIPSNEVIQSCLLPACGVGNLTMVKTLIQLGANPKQRLGSETQTLLTAACKAKSKSVVELLIEKKANRNKSNSSREKPIALAASINMDFFNLFVAPNTNFKEKFGPNVDKTLAHYAAEGNNTELIYTLISNEVNIDEPDLEGITPLMISIQKCAYLTFSILICGGADPSRASNKKMTALDYAVESETEDFMTELLELEKVKNNTNLLFQALKTATLSRNKGRMNVLSKALGITTTVKYGLVALAGGAIALAIVNKWFNSSNE